MYTIYEIPGVKIGVTDNFNRRQKEQLSKGEMIELESHSCIYKVSERERELQAEKGYKVDKHPYWHVVKVMIPKSMTPEVIKKRVENTDYTKIDQKARIANTDYAARAANTDFKARTANKDYIGEKVDWMIPVEAFKVLEVIKEGRRIVDLITQPVGVFNGRGEAARQLGLQQAQVSMIVNPKLSTQTAKAKDGTRYTFKSV